MARKYLPLTGEGHPARAIAWEHCLARNTVLKYLGFLAAIILLTLIVTVAATAPGVSAQGGDDTQAPPPKPTLTYPNLSTHLNHLVGGYSSGHMSEQEAAGEAPIHSGGSVAVTIHLDGHVSDVVAFLEDNGGDPRNTGSDYIEAYVPVGLLGRLSMQTGITRVWEIIPPQPTYGNVTSQAVGLHLADSWQAAGYRGQGVKIGVIDVGFRGYSGLMGLELPSNVVARCYTDVGVYSSNLADCEALDPPSPSTPAQCLSFVQPTAITGVHGTAVAEAVIDIAPDATLYISQPGSWGDLQETAAWMVGQGVQVINYSVSWVSYGPGDGTSPVSSNPLNTVDQAVDAGAIWINAAGNSAEDTWFGSYSDPDGDNRISFDGSDKEVNPISLQECRRYTVTLRWEDSWGGANTDLDLYLANRHTGELHSVVRSVNDQSGNSADVPFEVFVFTALINSDDYGLVIIHEEGPVPDWIQLELFSGPGGLGIPTGSGSIGNPAESANPGMLAVGAAPFYDTNTIEYFSSRGPTPDGRTKPDIVGVDCAASVSYPRIVRRDNGQECWFPGTSQASPHVAGLAALVKQRFPEFTPEQVADYLKDTAQQRESPDPNNTWGHGFAQLPPPTCGENLSADGGVDGTWAPGCDSEVSKRGHARYYSFTLAEESEVAISLESDDADTYLYLREGDARSGAFLYQDDDSPDTTRSEIAATLSAGDYTIEATTYSAGETGSFTLTVRGLGGTAPGTDPGIDECGQTLAGDGSVDGTWAPGCDSEVSKRGHARYYSFTLTEESEVTISLESNYADTYLYLREGYARSGAFLYQDDDSPDTTRSEIVATLSAGDYTIEATTYSSGETGSFTLTVSGLGGAAGPGPSTGCGTTVPYNSQTVGYEFPYVSWDVGCQSQVSGRGYAWYLTFTLGQESEVTITLESDDADTYLYLREGEARSGPFLHENDDHEGSAAKSQIQETLAAGSYTIEATTYSPGETGGFGLTVFGPGGSGAPPEPSADPCYRDPLPGDGVYADRWAAGCDSAVSDRGHALYYGFTLEQESEVTITLESQDADTFLYLRQGADAKSGAALYENDDHEGSTAKSQIQETLAAGSYTIEATTYSAGETGGFTLTVSGLGGSGAPPQEIVFAEPNWHSVQLQTNIARYMLEKGYGYSTQSGFGSTANLMTGLALGDIHVLMEVWLPNQSDFWDPALEAGEVLDLGPSLGQDWQSAFVIPAYLQEEHPELDSVDDLKEQRYKSLFQPEETGGKALLVSCVVGWACEPINAAQVTGYGLDEHVHIVNPGSEDALFASINGAYQRQEPWLGYMWGTGDPALLLDLVRLEEPPYSDECWDSTRACAYEDATVLIGAHSSLPEQAPEVVEFLRKWDFTVDPHLRNVTRWQEANPDASIQEAALHWLRNNADTWSGWVTGDAAVRILSALSES